MTETPTMTNSKKPSVNSDSESNEAQPLSAKQTKDLIAWVNGEFTKCKNNRWKAEKQWYTNLAFYFGKQNIVVADERNAVGSGRVFKLYTPPAPYYRSRPVINLIRPRLRTEMAKLTAQKPNAFVVPASSDDRDMYAANAGEQIWDSLFRSKNLHRILRRAVFWTTVTGNGFIKSYWDEYYPDYENDVLGDICYESVTPFHLFVPDLKEVDLEEQAYVIHAANRNAEEIEILYGKPLVDDKAKGDLLEESFISAMGIDNQKAEKDKNTLVLEMWIRPHKNKRMPNGGMITVAGNSIIQYVEGWPYEHDKYPFAHIRHVETGKFYGDSTIVDLIPLQREYNRTRGQIIEAKNRMAKPQLAAEIGSIDANKVTSEPGQIILYKPGFSAPQPIPLQALPSYVLQEQDRIRMDMDEISGQHEVSRGQVPPGVTAATAISYLQEQDESKLSYTFDSIEEAYEKLAFMTLSYVKQFWDTQRKVKITGADGSFDVMAFEGSDLGGNTDVRIEAGSALPTSRAAKQAFIMDLMKMGFIDPNKGLEVMEIGGINKIYEQIQVDVRQAQRENLKMAQATQELIDQNRLEEIQKFLQTDHGQGLLQSQLLLEGPGGDLLDASPALQGMPPVPVSLPLIVPVNTWDDHRTHIEVHNKYRKSQAYDQLTQEAKDLFEQHVQQHVSAIMVGAQGAMGMPPGLLEMANNPETVKEMMNNPGDPSQTGLPPVNGQMEQQEQIAPEQGSEGMEI